MWHFVTSAFQSSHSVAESDGPRRRQVDLVQGLLHDGMELSRRHHGRRPLVAHHRWEGEAMQTHGHHGRGQRNWRSWSGTFPSAVAVDSAAVVLYFFEDLAAFDVVVVVVPDVVIVLVDVNFSVVFIEPRVIYGNKLDRKIFDRRIFDAKKKHIRCVQMSEQCSSGT